MSPRLRYLLLVILAGESIFILPFVLIRVFRPTVMTAYGVDNTEVGVWFAVYGLVALGSYVVGGPLADRFAPRKLMGTALLLTAAAGPVYALLPEPTVVRWVYGYWGFTTIFLFWAAMVKATRVWGGAGAQGRAFGFLDGGRGLVGALFGLLGVSILNALGGAAAGAEAYPTIVLVCSGLVAGVGLLVYTGLRLPAGTTTGEEPATAGRIRRAHVAAVLRMPTVWLLMVIILCAYMGYRATDILSLYASEVMGYDDLAAARLGTFLLFLRPVVGVSAGLLADRRRPSLYLIGSFVLTAIASGLFALGTAASGSALLFFCSVLTLAAGVYAGRALYFAVLREGRIPLALTGTAVGLVSFVGYTPDIFAGLLYGHYLDAYPGPVGHRIVYLILGGFSLVGLVAAVAYARLGRR